MAKKEQRTRAANGMGTVRQRADGRWEARYTVPGGGQKSIYAKSEAEVTKKLRAVLHDIDSGGWLEPSRMTVAEWLEIWLRDYQGHTTGRTVETYTGVVNRHMVPTFGKIKMDKLSPIHVRRMVANMQKKGLSPATIRHASGILGAAMKCAIEAGIIKNNPVDGIKLPRRIKTKFEVVDREHIPAFMAAAQDTAFPNELMLMLFTGLRVGEVRGIMWDDIDFEHHTLHVQRQLHPATHNVRFGPPKDGEDRIIELAPEAVDILRQQRKRQAEQRLAAGDKWHDDEMFRGLVFLQRTGKPHSELSIYKAVRQAGRAIGIPELTPHDLRHSYAVAALRSGADVKTVQHNLGHRNASITLDTYAAYTTDAGKEGARKLSEYIQNSQK